VKRAGELKLGDVFTKRSHVGGQVPPGFESPKK